MKKSTFLLSFFYVFLLLLTAIRAEALDYPHTSVNNITCEACHFVYGGEPSLLPGWTNVLTQNIDDSQYNILCWSCHNDIEATYVRTHSSLEIDSGYGDWTVECRVCHNPHTQRQFRTYPESSLIYTGISTDVTDTTLTQDVAGWTDDEHRGKVLIPDSVGTNKKYGYKIINNTSDTITVKGPINTAKVDIGDTFVVIYGNLINETITLDNITGVSKTGNKTVKFFNTTGTNSFADGDAAYDGICEVCHTETLFHKNDGTGISHNAGVQCTTCHKHTEGFKGSGCDVCHGYPPIIDAATGGPSGLVNYLGSTGSTTAGVHDLHANTKGFPCSNCHYESSGSGPTHINSLKITMGFYTFGGAYQGGAYDGQEYDGEEGVSYDTTTTNPVTTVSSEGSKSCSNIYCHGNYNGSGLNASPIWDDAASAACGTCHGASNTSPPGIESPTNWDTSHVRHAFNGQNMFYDTWPREYACTLCHKDIIEGEGPADYSIKDSTRHVNSTVDWNFNTEDTRISAGTSYSVPAGTQPPTDGSSPRAYGTCSNVYCHSNVQPDGGVGPPTVYDNPQWGNDNSACVGCHAKGYHSQEIDTGSHEKHVQEYYFGMSLSDPWSVKKCTICHKWNPSASRTSCGQQCHDGDEKTYHVNGNIDVLFDDFAADNGSYNGTPEPGDGYSSCSNIYCHSNGTSVSTGIIPFNTTDDWGASGPLACNSCHNSSPAYTNGSPKANSHQQHNFTCDNCHFATTTTGSTITNSEKHVNKTYDLMPGSGENFNYAYDADGGSCDNISCHGGSSATWGGSLECDSCHGYPPVSGDGLNVNDQYDGGKGAHVTALEASYGEGGHMINSSSLNPAQDSYGDTITGYNECYKCHQDGNHGDGTVDVRITTYPWSTEVPGRVRTYSRPNGFGLFGAPEYLGVPGDIGTDKTCSSILCHMGATPRWSCPGDE